MAYTQQQTPTPEIVKLSQVKANSANPRSISGAQFQRLVDSLLVLPKMLELRPIVVDATMTALGGNMRYRALCAIADMSYDAIGNRLAQLPDFVKKTKPEQEALLNRWLVWRDAPTAVILRADQLTDAEAREFIIKDNVGFGEWDYDALANEWDEAELKDWGLDVWQPDDEGLDEDADLEAQEDNYSDEDTDNAPTRCKAGDLWLLGEHRLLCGDSTKSEDVDRLMGGELADLLLTDPPYNVAYEGSTKDKLTIANDNMDDASFLAFLKEAFKNAFSSMRPGAAYYIWHAGTAGYEFKAALKACNITLREVLVWVKPHFRLGRQDYQWRHEPCLYGWKDGAAHYFINDRTQSTVFEDAGVDYKKLKKDELIQLVKQMTDVSTPNTIIYEDKPTRNDVHPTMKPVKLMERLIKNSSKQEQLVLDLFGGSGSTLIACEQLNRRCFSMEFDPKYCDAILDRWEKLTGKTATLEADTND
nr:MAG TPA: adenine specific DNA methyltransferase [Caudoviricetes sp.]